MSIGAAQLDLFTPLAPTPEPPATAPDPLAGLLVSLQQPLAEQVVALSGTSSQSNSFNAQTRFVRLQTDVVCAIEFGTNPTAVGSGGGSPTARMAANQTEYYGVPVNQSYMVAGVTSS